jgi:ribonuclease-3
MSKMKIRLTNIRKKKDYVQKDAKTRLQEWCQARGYSLPEYTIVVSDLHADYPFAGKVVVQSAGLQASGTGKNKRAAEMHAAQVLLDKQGE